MKIIDKKQGIIQITGREAFILYTGLKENQAFFEAILEQYPKDSHKHEIGMEGLHSSIDMQEEFKALSQPGVICKI
jgi:hypothetical protein